MECCYSTESYIKFGNHSLLSRCGVQQGDPLGPLCFALTLQPIIERIKREFISLLCNAWYLDDGTLCGTPQDLDAALKIIEEEVEDIMGGPLSDLAWLKANLPCSLGGLYLRSAVLHAPAAYISSIMNSLDLASQILGYTPNLLLALPSAISSLARSARMTSWCSLEDIDVPFQQ